MVTICFPLATAGRQFRLMTPIETAAAQKTRLPPGAIDASHLDPLSREDLEPMVRNALEQWNGQDMSSTLSEAFYDKSRLLDGVDTIVPRDASLRVQSVQGVQTLQQYIQPNEGGISEHVSVVSATVQTQLEFNGPNGFVRRQGTNEFILEVTVAAE